MSAKLLDDNNKVARKVAEWALFVSAHGHHSLNPYHNVKHHQHVLDWACAMWNYTHMGSGQPAPLEMILAAAMHDFDHSGGVEPDSENIQHALHGVGRLACHPVVEHYGIHIPTVEYLIRVTEFDGATKNFKHPDPQRFMLDMGVVKEDWRFAAACLRDADLCSIYSPSALEYMSGLYDEILVTNPTLLPSVFLVGNRKFLEAAQMHTTFGSNTKKRHLEARLQFVEANFQDYRRALSK